MNADGYITIRDRSKDIIKSGGEWISSVELENIAIAHPKLADAAVIGAEQTLALAVRSVRNTARDPAAWIPPMVFPLLLAAIFTYGVFESATYPWQVAVLPAVAIIGLKLRAVLR